MKLEVTTILNLGVQNACAFLHAFANTEPRVTMLTYLTHLEMRVTFVVIRCTLGVFWEMMIAQMKASPFFVEYA